MIEIYHDWDPAHLVLLKEKFSSSLNNEDGEAYNAYERIPLVRIAQKHELDSRLVTEFANWLGAGIGTTEERRQDLPAMLRESNVLNPQVIINLAENDGLLCDLIEFAQKIQMHYKGRSQKLDGFLSQPMERRVKVAKKYILDALRHAGGVL